MDAAKLKRIPAPFDGKDWLFELKHDGFRALAYIYEGKCDLVSRRRNSFKSFQNLGSVLANLKVKTAVLDGEVVCLDSEGRSIFDELMHRRGEPAFYAFDLLYLNGKDLRRLPLIERKRHLKKLLKSCPPRVICGSYVEGRGVELFDEICRRNLEGIVAKRKDQAYVAKRGWLKIKNPNYTQSERRHELFETFKKKPT